MPTLNPDIAIHLLAMLIKSHIVLWVEFEQPLLVNLKPSYCGDLEYLWMD